jgi:hypothetical protein
MVAHKKIIVNEFFKGVESLGKMYGSDKCVIFPQIDFIKYLTVLIRFLVGC